MVVGVVGGLVVIFSAGFATWTYAKGKLTADVNERLDVIEGKVASLIISVDGLSVLVVDKKYEMDKDMILMTIEAYELRRKAELAQRP